jgi:uncharacterized membrane-anchored protein YjiN (DUF445 family)
MDDQTRASRLRQIQRVATGLLIGVTLVFVATLFLRERWPWIDALRAFSEAAMIGALADWFAVTALFRHPLGLKIPHTAIVPARKAKIAEAFGGFVERNFLDPGRIAERVRRTDPAARLAQWLRSGEHSQQVADFASESLSGMLRFVSADDVGGLLQRGLSERLAAVPAAPLIGRLLGVVVADQRQRETLSQIIRLLTDWIEENEAGIRERIAGEFPRWFPRVVDRVIYERLLDSARRTLVEIEADPNHPLYDQFSQVLDRWIVNLQYDPEVVARGETIKSDLLSHPLLRDLTDSVWSDIKHSLFDQINGPEAPLRAGIEQGLIRLGEVLETDPEWRDRVGGWAENLTHFIVQRYGRSAGEFITQTVQAWDTEETTRKIELQFGRDLQFIRINGTIVGGLAGLVIYALTHLLG